MHLHMFVTVTVSIALRRINLSRIVDNRIDPGQQGEMLPLGK